MSEHDTNKDNYSEWHLQVYCRRKHLKPFKVSSKIDKRKVKVKSLQALQTPPFEHSMKYLCLESKRHQTTTESCVREA